MMVLSRKEIGQKIKNARSVKSEKIKSKYTQEMLAADIEISRSYLGDIEAGRKYPNYLLLSKIAEACGVSIEFLTNDSPVVYNSDQTDNSLFDERLTEDEVVAVKTFLEVYRKQKQSQ